MNKNRLRKAQGEDMGGKNIYSRLSGMDSDMLSPLEKGMIVKQFGDELRGDKSSRRGAEPSPDPKAGAGAAMAHTGRHGAPNIYREKPGGRAGMRGKRGA